MAESRSWAIILALQTQLQTITQANGYLTDLGTAVWVNDGQRPSPDAFGLMLYSESIVGPGLDRERPGKPVRDFGILIEGAITSDRTTLVACSIASVRSLTGESRRSIQMPSLFEQWKKS